MFELHATIKHVLASHRAQLPGYAGLATLRPYVLCYTALDGLSHTTPLELQHCQLPESLGISHHHLQCLESPGRTTFWVSARHNGGMVSSHPELNSASTYQWTSRPSFPGPCSWSHEPTTLLAGDRTRFAEVHIPLDQTTEDALPNCADWCRSNCAGLARVGSGLRP